MKVVKWESGKGRNRKLNLFTFMFSQVHTTCAARPYLTFRATGIVFRFSNFFMAKAQSEEYVEVEGKIVAVLPGTMFRVELANGHQVLAHISGKLRKHFIKITTGDTVKMEMSPYDLDKARIVYRLRNAQVQRNAPKRSYGPRRR